MTQYEKFHQTISTMSEIADRLLWVEKESRKEHYSDEEARELFESEFGKPEYLGELLSEADNNVITYLSASYDEEERELELSGPESEMLSNYISARRLTRETLRRVTETNDIQDEYNRSGSDEKVFQDILEGNAEALLWELDPDSDDIDFGSLGLS